MMNVQRLTIIAAAVAAGLAFSGASHALTYSLGGDFSDTVNPNGVWSFVQGTTPLAHYLPSGSSNALNTALSNGFWGPGPNLDSATPIIGKVTSHGAAATG